MVWRSRIAPRVPERRFAPDLAAQFRTVDPPFRETADFLAAPPTGWSSAAGRRSVVTVVVMHVQMWIAVDVGLSSARVRYSR